MGLFFDILAVESESVYARRGQVQRIAGVQPQWFHHPDALRIQEPEFSKFTAAFRLAHPNFNYNGPTEYKAQQISQLCVELKAWLRGHEEVLGETEFVIQEILNVANRAQRHRQSLLVLGI